MSGSRDSSRALPVEELADTVTLLQDELAQSNREVVALALELEERVDELKRSNEALLAEIEERRRAERERESLHEALQHAYEDLRRSQEKLVQQERLRALGQMSSGIAHDINNAISPVALYTAALLENEPALSERAREYLAVIQRAIDDVASTVARMREFYRPRESHLQLAPVSLNEIVEHVIPLTRARWSDLPQRRGLVIDIRTELAADLPAIMGVEHEIRDALTNLVFNAVDAMPQGGVLTLRTSVRKYEAQQHGEAAAEHALVEVKDTGVGMDETTQRRCLEPFYTTKGERGTGMGLAMVYGMTRRHSAGLEIDSHQGAGTTMRLIFPVSKPARASRQDPPPAHAARRRVRILLVDDDPLLVRSLRDVLELDGHRVQIADGGQSGIEAFTVAHRTEQPFELVITDLGMPYVDGGKVAAAVKAISESTPVVLLTGWGKHMSDGNEPVAKVDRILAKPPRIAELRQSIQDLVP